MADRTLADAIREALVVEENLKLRELLARAADWMQPCVHRPPCRCNSNPELLAEIREAIR